MASVIEGHLRPTELASGIVSMIDTYIDLIGDTPDSQRGRDQLADAIASGLETLINNQGLVEGLNILAKVADEGY